MPPQASQITIRFSGGDPGGGVRDCEELGLSHLMLAKRNQFKYLVPIAFCRALVNRRKEKPNQIVPSIYFEQFRMSFPLEAAYIEKFRKHSEVGFSEERQRFQEKKMDVLPKFPTDQISSVAKHYTYRMYAPALERTVCFVFSFERDKGSGHPYPSLGLNTKGEALESPVHAKLVELRPDPIWKNTGKGSEAIPDEDLIVVIDMDPSSPTCGQVIDPGKLRTFNQVPVYFASWQKFFFQNQNEAMKKIFEHTWGKYGYVKQYGGLDRLFKSLEGFDTVFMLDVSGYDRTACLKSVYEYRELGLKRADPETFSKFEEEFRWVVKNTVTPLNAFVDGSVYRRLTGNNSGSNNTTTDNTLLHTEIMFYFVLHCGLEKLGRVLEYEECLEAVKACLFGDDNLTGMNRGFFNIDSEEELKKILVEVFGRFGMRVKDRAVKIQFKDPKAPIEGMEFLGSTGVWSEKYQQYLARPRVSKLMYSLTSVYSGDQETASAVVAKATDICKLISWTEDEGLKVAVRSYCSFLYRKVREENLDVPETVITSLYDVSRGVMDHCLFLGMEGNALPLDF